MGLIQPVLVKIGFRFASTSLNSTNSKSERIIIMNRNGEGAGLFRLLFINYYVEKYNYCSIFLYVIINRHVP